MQSRALKNCRLPAMKIVFAASECAPYAKTGGLGDVVGALPRELARQGHDVTTYLPLYKQVSSYLAGKLTPRVVAHPSITVPFSYYNRFATILDGGKPLPRSQSGPVTGAAQDILAQLNAITQAEAPGNTVHA